MAQKEAPRCPLLLILLVVQMPARPLQWLFPLTVWCSRGSPGRSGPGTQPEHGWWWMINF